MHKIIEKKRLNETTHLIVVEARHIVKNALPGQFIILRAGAKSERIPLTIYDTDKAKGTVSLIFQELGKSTKELGMLNSGDSISDILGPLGEPSPIKHYGTVICIGGGVGIAEIYPVARALKEKNNNVIVIIGSRNKDLLILKDELVGVSNELHISTDDGSLGHHGFVTDILKQILSQQKIDIIFAVGPIPMMKRVADITRPDNIKTIVSLNSIMVDGTGMCGSCRVTVKGKTRFVCVDGPDFDAHEVDFDELSKRQVRFDAQEKNSIKHYKQHRGCAI